MFDLPHGPVCSVCWPGSGLVLQHRLSSLKSSSFHVAVVSGWETRLTRTQEPLRVEFESASNVTEEQSDHVIPRPTSALRQDLPRDSWRSHKYEKPLPLLFYSIYVYYFPAVSRMHSWRPILRNFENIINRNIALSKLLILENVVDSHQQQMPCKNDKHDLICTKKERHPSAVPPLHARPPHENWKRNLVTKSFFFFLCIV